MGDLRLILYSFTEAFQEFWPHFHHLAALQNSELFRRTFSLTEYLHWVFVKFSRQKELHSHSCLHLHWSFAVRMKRGISFYELKLQKQCIHLEVSIFRVLVPVLDYAYKVWSYLTSLSKSDLPLRKVNGFCTPQ